MDAAATVRPPVVRSGSIKPNNSNRGGSVSGYRPGDVYIATNVSLKSLITEAYGIRDFQLQGASNWIDKDRFDVQARGDSAGPLPAGAQNIDRARLLLKLQSLLEDRFRLKMHDETREPPVYALIVGKGGPKLKAAAESVAGQCGRPGGPSCPGTRIQCCEAGMMDLVATHVSMPLFAESLSQKMSRQVIDKTDIQGAFDIKLRWLREDLTPVAADVAGEPQGPAIFTAIQEQLGLRLEPARGPVRVFVIDSVERPTEN